MLDDGAVLELEDGAALELEEGALLELLLLELGALLDLDPELACLIERDLELERSVEVEDDELLDAP